MSNALSSSIASQVGDVVLFRSDYSDNYYRPFPEGVGTSLRFSIEKSPGYPDPDPDCMEFLASRGVMTLGTDSASMGPLPDLAEPTHYAGLKHGMIWTEGATNLGELPPTGAFYCMLGPKRRRWPVLRNAGVCDRGWRAAGAAH